jgi:hypothetical protein
MFSLNIVPYTAFLQNSLYIAITAKLFVQICSDASGREQKNPDSQNLSLWCLVSKLYYLWSYDTEPSCWFGVSPRISLCGQTYL